ncbi:uncharacterized protein LOC132262057 [Phlebotomus argentipes]|uniref:uncharacterized protein LOC132262057 n=1 Tax=Phlebotomus argentipes TaxID=94469 RepID=UPI002892D2FF|nr:uncharacterized protein LOC132262057 [Phlebotomus argentipes]
MSKYGKKQVDELSRKVSILEEENRKLTRKNEVLKEELAKAKNIMREHLIKSQELQQDLIVHQMKQFDQSTESTYQFNQLPVSRFAPGVIVKSNFTHKMSTLNESQREEEDFEGKND